MDSQARELANRLKEFNERVIEFVSNCNDEDWRKICSWEQWPVGVTARHIGAGHFQALALAGNIIRGEKMPEVTPEKITAMANQHAREHADCTRQEVLEFLAEVGRKSAEFMSRIDDSDLDRTSYLPVMGREVSARQFIETVILESGGEHFANMKAAVEKQ